MALNRVEIINSSKYAWRTGGMKLKDGEKNCLTLRDAELGKIYYYRRRMNECYFIKLHRTHKNARNAIVYSMTTYKFLCGTQENKERVDKLLYMFYNGMTIEDLIAFYEL